MPTLGFPLPTREMDLAQLAEYLAKVVKEIEWALANMDAKNIKANSITANEIKVGTITADRMNVQELSAITANLGHITAGLIEAVEIYGSYIATSTSYPRIEFSSTDKLLKAFLDASHYIYISPDEVGSPTLGFQIPGGFCSIFMAPDDSGNFTINAGGNLNLFSNTNVVKVANWAGFLNAGTNRTLQQDLNDLDDRISALESAPPA